MCTRKGKNKRGEKVECREAINIKLMLGNERKKEGKKILFQGRRLM